jgi:hypothetical protein
MSLAGVSAIAMGIVTGCGVSGPGATASPSPTPSPTAAPTATGAMNLVEASQAGDLPPGTTTWQ